jgi:hypothetical protein
VVTPPARFTEEESALHEYLKNKSVQDSIVALALGIALGVYSLYSYQSAVVRTDWIMSPYLFPLLLATFAVAIAFSLFMEGRFEVVTAREKEGKTDVSVARMDIKKLLCVIGLGIAYVILINFITFIPASVLYLAAMIWLLGERRIWMVAAISVGMPLLLYVLFAVLLNVRLP